MSTPRRPIRLRRPRSVAFGRASHWADRDGSLGAWWNTGTMATSCAVGGLTLKVPREHGPAATSPTVHRQDRAPCGDEAGRAEAGLGPIIRVPMADGPGMTLESGIVTS